MALTKNDLNQIKNLLDNQEVKFEGKLDDQEAKFEAKIVEVKSEFFEKIDPVLKEVTTARDERTLIENRLEKLEEIHQTGEHALAS
jgi:oligoendopeptidase F